MSWESIHTIGGKHTKKYLIDPEKQIIRKEVTVLDNFKGGLSEIPSVEQFQTDIQKSIDFLIDPKWGLGDFIPDARLIIEPNEHSINGYFCWVEMKYIQGFPLETISNPPESVLDQLGNFIEKISDMAKTTKPSGTIVLPDILGGIIQPMEKFSNFVIDENNRLFFTDIYPLASLQTGIFHAFDRKNYKRHLWLACSKYNHQKLAERTQQLIKCI